MNQKEEGNERREKEEKSSKRRKHREREGGNREVEYSGLRWIETGKSNETRRIETENSMKRGRKKIYQRE